MKKIAFIHIVGVLAVVGSLISCGGSNAPSPVLDANGQPTGQVVQQQQSPGLLGMFGAALGGTMVGNMLSRPHSSGPSYVAPSQTVVNKTVINKTIIHAPTMTTSPRIQPPRPTTSFRSSNSFSRGGRR